MKSIEIFSFRARGRHWTSVPVAPSVSTWSGKLMVQTKKGFQQTPSNRKKKTKFMVLMITVVAWLCVQAVYGQENSCKVEYTEEVCAKRVICIFKDKVVKEEREFTISLREDSAEKTIAVCNWLGPEKVNCDPAKGYTCNLQPTGNINVDINKHEKCIKSGEFLFDVAHEEIFSCEIAPNQVNSDNASANANPESPNKCRNGSDEKSNGQNEKKRITDESEDLCQEGTSEQETNVGMIIGVVCTCLSVGLVALFLVVKRKELVAFVKKRKRHEGNCVEAPANNTAFKDSENTECLITETADSAKADTLEEEDAVLEALHLRSGINHEVNTNVKNINPSEHDLAFDIRSAQCASTCDVDDNDCGSSSKHTYIIS